MPDDEVTTIRQIRHEISEECGHNVHKVAAYYRTVEKELKQSRDFHFEDGSFAAGSEPSTTDAESGK
ncbi:MAG: hypothetical protein ACYSWU_18625 [Planctomycetota bacterium]|jgi:hypothetical protein